MAQREGLLVHLAIGYKFWGFVNISIYILRENLYVFAFCCTWALVKWSTEEKKRIRSLVRLSLSLGLTAREESEGTRAMLYLRIAHRSRTPTSFRYGDELSEALYSEESRRREDRRWYPRPECAPEDRRLC